MTTQYNKTWLEKEVAKRSGFRIADVGDMFDAYQEVLEEIIYNKGLELKEKQPESHSIEVLKVANMFTLYLKEVGEHEGFDAVRKQRLFIPTSYRIIFSASRSLLSLLRKGDLIEPDEEEEI